MHICGAGAWHDFSLLHSRADALLRETAGTILQSNACGTMATIDTLLGSLVSRDDLMKRLRLGGKSERHQTLQSVRGRPSNAKPVLW